MKKRHCKLCGQVLTPDTIKMVRNRGRAARKLSDAARAMLRADIKLREEKMALREPHDTIEEIARRHGINRRTVARERDWMMLDGSL